MVSVATPYVDTTQKEEIQTPNTVQEMVQVA